MSEGSVTTTGLTELMQGIENLPRSVTLALRNVAWHTSRRVQARARELLNQQTHGTGKTAASIEIIEEESQKQFLVWVKGNPDRPVNLPDWLEFGTAKMSARPYMRPAGDEVNEPYKREMAQAAIAVAEETFK